jgi:hypothetical protein
MSKAGVIAVGVVLVCGGVASLIWIQSAQRNARASRSWPTVKGRIDRCDVYEHKTRVRGVTSIVYDLKAEYSYEVDGKRYRATRVQFFPLQYLTEVEAREVADRIVSSSTVHYDSNNPEVCVLLPGLPSGGHLWGASIAAYVALGLGVVILLVMLFGGRYSPNP